MKQQTMQDWKVNPNVVQQSRNQWGFRIGRLGSMVRINGLTNLVFATIPVGVQPIEVGVNSSTNRIYVANSFNDNVSVINGGSNTVMATVSVGDFPFGVGINP
jgi:YVTN family beta-propeller protein